MKTDKQKALDHVRSVCPDLTERIPTVSGLDGERVVGHTPHLEHWLRGIDGGIETHLDEGVFEILMFSKWVKYDLTKDGENQSEEFYKAYCEIVGV
ncbi:MAG: hypothetical protein AB3N13_09635 [Arenibacterium sp.]